MFTCATLIEPNTINNTFFGMRCNDLRFLQHGNVQLGMVKKGAIDVCVVIFVFISLHVVSLFLHQLPLKLIVV